MLKVLSTVRPRSLFIAAAIINSATELNLIVDMFITCGNNGKHMVISKHYSDEALDFRSKHLNKVDKQRLIKEVARRLGEKYQVFIEDAGKENEHIHAEYDPVNDK